MLHTENQYSHSHVLVVPSGKFMNIFNGHAAPVTAGQFTADGKNIVSVSEDSSFIVWDPKSAAANVKLTGADGRFHSEPINCISTDKESNLALTGSADGTAKLVNLHSGNVCLIWVSYLTTNITIG
jgi:WD40 repeat protein